MSYLHSKEQTIYRSLAGELQLGFYDDGGRFPSAQEIARRYQVSYCPAQRALKRLEQEQLIKLCRGKETIVLKKPYDNFLESDIFHARAVALVDLASSLAILSPSICLHGIYRMQASGDKISDLDGAEERAVGKRLYQLFMESLHACGNKTILSLFSDIGSFSQSAFLDIFRALLGEAKAEQRLRRLTNSFQLCVLQCRKEEPAIVKKRLKDLGTEFFEIIKRYDYKSSGGRSMERFEWVPHKGRARYCDVIAIDLVCKINQGAYSMNTLLPNITVLSDIYHVSPITMRRTISLLNNLGVVKTMNGVGTEVIFEGNAEVLDKFRDFMLDENLRSFLEALQLLAITCEPVIGFTFEHISGELLRELTQAVCEKEPKAALVSTIGACLQAVVHCCPLAAVRRIYEELTLLLLKGSVLRLKPGNLEITQWPELSRLLLHSLNNGDALRFSSAFHQMMECVFILMKRNLLDLGVNGIDQISIAIQDSGVDKIYKL